MTPQEFLDTIAYVKQKMILGKSVFNDLGALVDRVEAVSNRNDPLTLPLTQTEVDHYLTVYTPLYLAILPRIEQVGDALGTDVFS